MSKSQKKKTENENTKKSLTRKSILLIATGALLLVLLVVGAAAWYTRLTTVNKLTLDAANFDFKANYTDEDFIIYASDYINLEEKLAAPGTIGVVPLLVSAQDSDVDVQYTIKVDCSGMDSEFRRRIRYFYFDKDGNEKTFDGTNCISGTIARGTHEPQYEYVYWEWVYELSPESYYLPDQNQWKFNNEAEYPYIASDSEAFDRFDTSIGEGDFDDRYVSPDGSVYEKISQERPDGTTYVLYAYQGAMEAQIKVSGAQATPKHVEDTTPAPTQPSGCGSKRLEIIEVINRHKAGQRG